MAIYDSVQRRRCIIYNMREQIQHDAHAGHNVISTALFADAGQAYCVDCDAYYDRVVLRSLETEAI
jgi:hypothetical protein